MKTGLRRMEWFNARSATLLHPSSFSAPALAKPGESSHPARAMQSPTALRRCCTSIELLEARIAPAFAAAISLGALSGTDGFKLSGVADFDNAGFSCGNVMGMGSGDIF